MSNHSSEAAELRMIVADIALATNALLTRAAELKTDAEEVAGRIQALGTHNLDIAHAAALLSQSIEPDFRAVFSKFVLAVRILEDYAGKA